MTTQHTQGRLKIGERQRDVFAILAEIDECPVGGAFSSEDARRLVAAWNACEGMPTTLLEASALHEITQNLLIAKVQRDELLAALKSAWLWMENQSDAQSKGGHATFDLMMLRYERDMARAAIAKVEGGAT